MNHITSIFVYFTLLWLLCSRHLIATLFLTAQLRHRIFRHLPTKIQLSTTVLNFCNEIGPYSLMSHNFPPSAGKMQLLARVKNFWYEMADTAWSQVNSRIERHEGWVTLRAVIGAVIPGGKVLCERSTECCCLRLWTRPLCVYSSWTAGLLLWVPPQSYKFFSARCESDEE